MSSKNVKARLQKRIAAKKRQEEALLQPLPFSHNEVSVEDDSPPPSHSVKLPDIFSFIATCSTAAELEAKILATPDKCEQSINYCSHTKGTPIIFAIWNATTTDRIDMLHVLLKYGAKLDVRDYATEFDMDENTVLPPLFVAVAKPCLSSLEILAKAGASFQDTVMLFSCIYKDQTLKHPPMNLFVWALCASARRCANRFLLRAAMVNGRNHTSAYGVPVPRTDPIGMLSKVSALMKSYSDTTSKSVDDSIYARLPGHQKSMVGCAVSIHAPATLALLLEMGADPNVADAEGWTPLYTACASGDDEMALFLIESGAVPDSKTLNEFGVEDAASSRFVHAALLRYRYLEKTGALKPRKTPTEPTWSASSPTAEEERSALSPLDEAQVAVIEDALGDAGFLDLEDATDLLPNKEV